MTADFLKPCIREVNGYLKRYMDLLQGTVPDNLKDAMEYSLFAGGKRIRPILLLEISKSLGADVRHSVPLACGIEMIHTYSLIHDDLPAMDDDDYRRGKLTSHKVYGEDMAILAGDALLNYAFEVMVDYSLTLKGEKLTNYIRGLNEIIQASGPRGMIKGQVEDTINDGNMDELKLNEVNAFKTGKLLKASVVAGAIAHGATLEVVEELGNYGTKIGSAFQIVDDILDVAGDERKTGKKLHSDKKNNKITYVDLYGVDGSKRIVDDLKKSALESLNKCNVDNEIILQLTEFICTRDY